MSKFVQLEFVRLLCLILFCLFFSQGVFILEQSDILQQHVSTPNLKTFVYYTENVFCVVFQSETRVVKQLHFSWPEESQEHLPSSRDILDLIADVQSSTPTRPIVVQCL